MHEFRPYFVVFRRVLSDGNASLTMEIKSFETLYSLYEFVSSIKDEVSFYSVGRCLELFLNSKV